MHSKPLQTLALLSAFGFALLSVNTASAETRRDEIYSSILSFNESMMPLLEQYLYIQAELANDSIWRVSRAGGMIALEAKNIDPTQIKSDLAQIFKYLPKRLRETGRKIYKAKDLKEMRELFALLIASPCHVGPRDRTCRDLDLLRLNLQRELASEKRTTGQSLLGTIHVA